MTVPTLHLLCGKIAAGKSTLARRLAEAPATVLVSEDSWLAGLYPDAIGSLEDYRRCSGLLRAVMAGHIPDLLAAGVSVVLDFPANTVRVRQWMRSVIDRAGAAHRLHVLDVPDAVCLERLRGRNRSGDHPFAPTEADFELFTAHFVPPTPAEGFDIVRHGRP